MALVVAAGLLEAPFTVGPPLANRRADPNHPHS